MLAAYHGGPVGAATTTAAIAIPAVTKVARPAGLELRERRVEVRPGDQLVGGASVLAASRATLDHRHRERFVGAGVGQTSSRPAVCACSREPQDVEGGRSRRNAPLSDPRYGPTAIARSSPQAVETLLHTGIALVSGTAVPSDGFRALSGSRQAMCAKRSTRRGR